MVVVVVGVVAVVVGVVAVVVGVVAVYEKDALTLAGAIGSACGW